MTSAPTKTMTPEHARAMSMRFVTVDTTRHARCSPSLSMTLARTGMSADDSAPAATSWNIRSGSRNAAKNASSSGGAGGCCR